MSSTQVFPQTSSDLRGIADQVDVIMAVLDPGGLGDLENGDWRWGVSVKVWYEDSLVGYIKPHSDGWLGFYPLAVTE